MTAGTGRAVSHRPVPPRGLARANSRTRRLGMKHMRRLTEQQVERVASALALRLAPGSPGAPAVQFVLSAFSCRV